MNTIDTKILHLLKENSRITSSEISKKVQLSIPAVTERIRKLEVAGIIEQYTIKMNRKALHYNVLAFLFVNVSTTEYIDSFLGSVTKHPAVLECHHLAGEYDYLLKVLVEDTNHLEDFISTFLKNIVGVNKTTTTIVLSTKKETMNIG